MSGARVNWDRKIRDWWLIVLARDELRRLPTAQRDS
jgi:hypothetical protein